jgi:hypothetical protein
VYNFWSVVARELTGVGPTLHCPSRGVEKCGRVAEAGNVGSAAFVNHYVCLKHNASVNGVARICGIEGGTPPGDFHGRYPDRACGSSLGLLPSTVVKEGKSVDV